MSTERAYTSRQRRRIREEREQAHEDRIQKSLKRGKSRDFVREVEALMAGEGPSLFWLGTLWNTTPVLKGQISREHTREQFYALIKVVSRKTKNLMTTQYMPILWKLAQWKWERSPEDWRPKGKSRDSRFRSLASHLLMKYPTPVFLLSTFHDEDEKWQPLAILVGQGGGLKQAQDYFPVKFTKRMWHMFLTSRASCSVLEAIRIVQVKVAGGDTRLVRAFLESPIGNRIGAFGRGSKPVAFHAEIEDFWNTFIAWTARQGMLDPNLISPLYDYLSQCRRVREQEDLRLPVERRRGPWELKGRTVASVMRGMELWHDNLAKAQKVAGGVYLPSGYAAGMWEAQQPWEKSPSLWTMEEILTGKRLAKEGTELRHCVYSYGSSILNGHISIWSLSRNDEPMITVEVSNQNRVIVQARGNCNRGMLPHEQNFLTRWARDNGLRLRA